MKNPSPKLMVLVRSSFFFCFFYVFISPEISAADKAKPSDKASKNGESASDLRKVGTDVDREANGMLESSSKTVRKFHEVLDELLAEFAYDVKLGQITGLKNLAIRKVEVSDALPDTYKDYVKLLLSERIKENSQVRLIHCIPCSVRTSKLIEGKLVITSPSTNVGELKAAADRLGIENFMDAVLIYHSTHMVLAVQVFKVDTNELVWARSYNSETVKSRYQSLAVDYSQIAKARLGEDYVPDYRWLVGFGAGSVPNVAGTVVDSSMIDFQFRGTERFNNRRTEFGLMMSVYMSLSSFLKEYPQAADSEPIQSIETTDPSVDTAAAGTKLQPFKLAVGLYGIYAHNFLGSVESYSNVRQGLHLGFGVLLAPSYLAGVARVGWDMYFGRRFSFSFSGLFVGQSNILVDQLFVQAPGGAGLDAVLSFNL
ncbi:MAG: hypothetical protein KA436_09955 [Oligoflexales bacterium]|nr:hypothetical protein [Oligoflexales bacterium]